MNTDKRGCVAGVWIRYTVDRLQYAFARAKSFLTVQELMLPRNSPATEWRHAVALGATPCLYPQLLRPKARKHGITQQRSCLTTQPVVAQRTTGRLLNQPTQTLKGFHNSDVCRTPSAFMDNPPPNPVCAARPGALLLKSFGLSFTPKKSKGLRSKLWVKTRASAMGT